ncbi:hypothetical protein ACTG16_22725 [Aeromonas sp. 23P]|uniref:hypothetical protein n=1 Tax=Aeromonas sp. 23P TaxID=3452716 RepID=UPI003F792219|nr:hypothetical protein [Aeromonas veronii]
MGNKFSLVFATVAVIVSFMGILFSVYPYEGKNWALSMIPLGMSSVGFMLASVGLFLACKNRNKG